ncbi:MULTISPECIES: hypothetical protein [Nocardia]|uniref:hypothetical protein n=1 Tax=Nocardia TaxID=1817 RepID=UPI000D687594|nr:MULTISPECIES: hypothetical protein [Nocardia]
MTNLSDWERQLQHQLDEIRASTVKLTDAASKIRGRSEIRGLTVEVDVTGEITSLQIAPGAMQWSSTQLSSALLDCHRRARADAATKVEQLLQGVDPRLRAGIEELRGDHDRKKPEPRGQMSEDEIQAADDAYYERRNTQGWNS